MISRTVGHQPFDEAGTTEGYQDRWEQWQHYYIQAFYMSRHYDVEKYQMYNEPNHSSNTELTQAGYLERLQLASDAIHSAIADVNSMFGKSLTAQVQGPVNSGGNKVISNSGTGWGELVIDNRHTDLFGDPDPDNDILQTYAYHLYNATGSGAASTLESVKEDIETVSGGEDIRVAITEFNVHSNSVFSGLTETLDTPSKYKTFGSVFSQLANEQPDELYVFKFGQTDAGRYYVYSTNVSGSNDAEMTLDLTRWGIQEGAVVTVEEVSETNHGEIAHLVNVPASGMVTFEQPASSVWLVTIPDGGPQTSVVITASEDASVSAGSNANVNDGNNQTLQVKNHSTDAGNRSVSYLKFDLGTLNTGLIDQAVLEVFGENTQSSAEVITHVYGIQDDSWSEDTITRNNAPNLSSSTGDVDGIEDNFIEGLGSSARLLGHLSASDDQASLKLDVTSLLKEHEDSFASILITRGVRWDGEVVDSDLGSLSIVSSESSSGNGPRLTLLVDQGLDFGDAPSTTPTLIADDGARHIAAGPRLGDTRDTEVDGQPTADASGDGSDEDGVMFGNVSVGSTMAGVNIDLQNAASAYVDAWLDFDGDGQWQEDEKILHNRLATQVAGSEVFNFTINDDAIVGTVLARVRISGQGGLGLTGLAVDGEVEDYTVEIGRQPSVENVQINEGDDQRSALRHVDVQFDQEVTAPNTAFQIRHLDSGELLNQQIVTNQIDPGSGKTTSRLTFGTSGNLVANFDNGVNSLIDGEYRLEIDGSQVTSVQGSASMSGDYSFGDQASDDFFRKYGDSDGNGQVGLADFAAFRATFGKSEGAQGFLSELDSDGNLNIGLADFAHFRSNFGS